MPLDAPRAEVFSHSEREQLLARRISDILAEKPPQKLMVPETEQKSLMQRLRERDRPIVASGGGRPPP
jgi:hypothetical protein